MTINYLQIQVNMSGKKVMQNGKKGVKKCMILGMLISHLADVFINSTNWISVLSWFIMKT